jgi:hypothetical protein
MVVVACVVVKPHAREVHAFAAFVGAAGHAVAHTLSTTSLPMVTVASGRQRSIHILLLRVAA